jgi:hypothetical protein
MKASVEVPHNVKTPSLFINPDEVAHMEQSFNQGNLEEEAGDVTVSSHYFFTMIMVGILKDTFHLIKDRCTQQHTAADDVRTGSTWRECDDTGLFGMACRHDQILNLINIVQSGEKCVVSLLQVKNIKLIAMTHSKILITL